MKKSSFIKLNKFIEELSNILEAYELDRANAMCAIEFMKGLKENSSIRL